MRRFLFALIAVPVFAAPAFADDFSRIPGHAGHRAFWLDSQPYPTAHETTAPRRRAEFTLTYTDGVAQRLGMGGGSRDIFARHLDGIGDPQLVGSVDGGPKLMLRWHPGGD
jgi:hypothetical protein